MSLSFLPAAVQRGLSHLNESFLSEIRLRYCQPVMVEFCGEYKFLGEYGITDDSKGAIVSGDLQGVVNAATDGCIYGYAEQMKGGFITVGHGIRIGLAGEYVTQNGAVNAVKSITSLNIRIPHDVKGCANAVFERLFQRQLHSVLIFSRPGLGKTTMLRDLARQIGERKKRNVLVFDERGEIAAMDLTGNGFDLGARVDVVRAGNKLAAISSAIRAMKPDVIVTDELYGGGDINTVVYAEECGIPIVASSHITFREKLKTMPFEYYVELTEIGGKPLIYDKNFNFVGVSRADDLYRGISVGG